MMHRSTITVLSVLSLGYSAALADSKGAPAGQPAGGSNISGPAGISPPAPPSQPPASQTPRGSTQGTNINPPAPPSVPQVPAPASAPPQTPPPASPPAPAPAAASASYTPGPGIWHRTFSPPSQVLSATVTQVGDGFRLTTEQFGELMSLTGLPMTWPAPAQVPLQIQRTWTPAANGLDISYTITNNSGSAQALPDLVVPGFNLEPQLHWLYFSPDAHFTNLSWTSGTTTVSPDVPYPWIMYAPMLVATDSRVGLGVALKYPVLQYKHNIRMILRRTAIESRWMSFIKLDGSIAPGETRTYGVTVRFTLPADWIHTLEPYRDYLHATYGPVHYTQDLRPVLPRDLGAISWISANNPRGFHQVFRADLNGWQHIVDDIISRATNLGYERVMVWEPAGLYNQHTENNYPPQMMTNWTTPMMTTASQWQRIPAAGLELGFWWGRSAQVANQWNDASLEAFSIHNSTHVATMLNEAQLAFSRGATTIGMDSFRMMNTWEAVSWLQQLSQISPTMRFVGEPSSNDVMNMFQPLAGDGPLYTRAPLLHDYLVPGREIWVYLRGDEANITRITQCIGWGLTVCIGSDMVSAHDVASAVEAAQSGWVLSPDAQVPPAQGPLYGD